MPHPPRRFLDANQNAMRVTRGYNLPMNALDQITARAAAHPKKIVLPEGDDARIVQAAAQIALRQIAEVIVLGDGAVHDALQNALRDAARDAGQSMDATMDAAQCTVINPHDNAHAARHAEIYMRATQRAQSNKKNGGKPISLRDAQEQIRAPLTLGACMLAAGEADGCVAGAAHTTGDVVRAALRIVGGKRASNSSSDSPCDSSSDSSSDSPSDSSPAPNLISSFFIMQHELPHQAIRGAALFADCAMVIAPDAAQLAQIAMDTGDSAKALLAMAPRVALLSFSTAGSANHPLVDKVREAGAIIARHRPQLEVLCEVQFDAAVDAEILRRKSPHNNIPAPANIFIFPDLQAANIGYKIAERLGAVRAIGPILQGLAKPMNDLSRGCQVEDIVALCAVTAAQASA